MVTHDVVTVTAHTHQTIEISDGEALENKLINCNADGASATITAHGTGWAIKHTAIVGHNSTDQPALDVSDRGGGHSVIDNVWLRSGGDGPALTVDRRHSGTLDISRTVIENFADGGFDSSAPVFGADGTTSYTNCYAGGCHAANFQTGTDELDGCVTADGDYTGRGVWARGNTGIVDCDLSTGGTHYAVHAGLAGHSVGVSVADTAYDDALGFFEEGGSTITTTNVSTDPASSPERPMPITEADAYEGTDSESAPSADVSESDFEVITPQYDGHATRSISGSETFSNTVFDLHHARTAATITAEGGPWTVENVAFEGPIDHPDTSPAMAMVVSVPAGDEAVIDNVWFGNGSSVIEANTNGQIAIYVRSDHAGKLTIRNCTFQYWPGGCVTCSSDTTGDIRVESSYFREFGYEGVALPTGASVADDCVFINTTGDYS